METDGVAVPVPVGEAPPPALWQGNRLAFDIASATASWLTLESERYAERRDRHGRVPSDASLLAAGGWLHRPPVHAYARLLAERLEASGELMERVPLWPNGKQYAVALTHDVDAPERRPRWGAALKKLAFGGHGSRRHAYWELRAEIRAHGLGEACFRPTTRRQEWGFPAICGLEKRFGLRSAFYFAVVNRSVGHPCDVAYDASRARYRRLFRRLLAGGWEVGLHAAYLTYLGVLPAEQQHRRVAELAGVRAAGVRHHYLQLGPNDPLRILTAHAAAGATYDSSIGYNDGPGFRLGAALPIELYDCDQGIASGLIELPMTLADMHLPEFDAPAATRAVVDHLETLRDLGGVGVLDWHVGVWHLAPAWRESYEAACEFLSGDSDAWIATPGEIADWWNRRNSMLHNRETT